MARTNLYNFTNRLLIIDVDGITIPANMPQEIPLPRGWNSTELVLSRTENHGINNQFSEGDKTFYFGNGVDPKVPTYEFNARQILENAFAANRFDARVGFRFEYLQGGQYVTLIDAQADFEFYDVKPGGVEIAVKEVKFNETFANRQDTTIDVLSETSLDGDAIAPTPSEQITLFSQPLIFGLRYEFDDPGSQANTPGLQVQEVPGTGSNIYVFRTIVQHGFPSKQSNSFDQGWFNVPSGLVNSPSNTEFQFKDVPPQFTAEFGGLYTYDIQVIPIVNTTATVIFGNPELSCSSGNLIDQVRLRTYIRINTAGGSVLAGINPVYEVSDGGVLLSLCGLGGGSATNSFDWQPGAPYQQGTGSLSGTTYIPAGGSIRVFTLLEIAGEYTTSGLLKGSFDLSYTTDQSTNSYFEITEAVTTTPTNVCNTYRLYDIMRHHLQAITGTDEPLDAPILDDGCQSNVSLASGLDIRSFPQSDASLNLTWLNLWNDVQARGGLGYDLRVVNDESVLRIRRYEFFYNNNVRLVIPNEQVIGVSVDTTYIYNNIKVGYNKYPKDDRVDDAASREAINTEQEYQTPVVRISNEAQYFSPFIASGELLEQTRRNQVTDGESKSTPNDQDAFIITTTVTDTFVSAEITFGDVRFLGPTNPALFPFIIGIAGENPAWASGSTLTIDGTTYTRAGLYAVQNGITYIEVTVNVSSLAPLYNEPVTFDQTFTAPESNQAFDVLTGVTDPDFVYNVRWAPRFMLLNQSPLFNSGFVSKGDTDLLRLTFSDTQAQLVTQFKAGECSTLDPEKDVIDHTSDIELQHINNRFALFDCSIIEAKAKLTWEQVLTVLANPYDKYSIEFRKGVFVTGWLEEFRYVPVTGEVSTIILRLEAPS